MQVKKSKDNKPQKNCLQDNNNYILTPEMVKETERALDEAKKGKVIPDDHFEKHFCK